MAVVVEHAPRWGIDATCKALGIGRATYFRKRSSAKGTARQVRPAPPRKLSEAERAGVLAVLHEARFADLAPAEVHAALLAEGKYLCSLRTMHRILAENDEAKERRNLARRATYTRPELLATGPNQLWSWDITKLRGPVKWSYFHLYVIIDVFSRYVVGWMVARRESAALAEQLIATTCERQQIQSEQLTLHADRGASMRSRPVAFLLADLGVTKTHSRPHVSNDNPYSESQFKTMKYRPDYPGRFGSLQDARSWANSFFTWYNSQHYPGGIGLLSPGTVHYGKAESALIKRQQVLESAYAARPERFVKGSPTVPALPRAVWINRPISLLELAAEHSKAH